MGYIKKLKNNELVGGTDKTTIYPVTSAEAVFEEVSDDEFKSQKYLNNHITNERIVDNTIENQKLKDDTIDMGKLNTQLKTIIQNAYDASWKVKEEPFSLETKYDANDVVYDPATNSSYVSLTADNQGNPVNPEDEGYVEGKWRIIINGISAVESTEVINAKVEELETEVDNKIDDAQGQLDQMIADAAASLADAESDARGAAAEASAVVANKVADAQIGYFECNTATGTALKQTTLDYIGTGNDKSYYTIPAAGSNVRIKMKYANTASGTVELQFGTNTATRKQLIYNGEPASDGNTWDDGEVISVYYDPTYNNNTGAYQASNAMGGGSAVGKKQLKGNSGFINLNIEIGQTVTTTVSSSQNAVYKEIKVKKGDVFLLTIKKSGTGGRAWGFIDSNRVLLDVAEANIALDNEVIVVPEGVDKVILHAAKSSEESEIIYEWYYAKAGSVGAHEILTEAYLYGDLRTLAVGQTYDKNEAVKTTDKQLLRVTKGIQKMNLVDEVAIGDLKAVTSGNELGTYQALKAVVAYDEEGEYSSGDYAIADGVVKVYDGEAWTAVVLADWVADTNMWASLDDEDLLTYTEQNSIQKEINSGGSVYNKLIDQELRSSMYAINENGKYGAGDVYYHFWCSVQQGQKYMIVPTSTVRYCFAKSHTVTKSGNIDLVDDTSVVILSRGETRIIEIPPTCNFLLLYFYDSTSHVYKYQDYLNDFPDIEKVKDCFYEKDVTSLVGTWACDDPTQNEINGNVWTLKKASNSSGRTYINVSNLTNGLLYRIHLKIVSSNKNGAVLSSLGYGSTKTDTWINVPVIKGRGSGFSFPYGNILDVVFEKTSDMSYVFFGSANSSLRTDYPVVITVDDFYVNEYASFSTNYPSLEQAVNELHNNSPIPSTLPPNYTYERYMELMTSQIYDRSSQAGCCYGNCFVQVFAANNSGNMAIRIYNLETKSLIQRVNLSGVDNHQTHANAVSFSINKYAEEDLFPLLYVPSGYPMTGTTTYQIYVIRFIGDTLGSLTAQIVQTINYEGSSWTDCVCDNAKERLWIITGSTCECIELPDISNQTVTIDANTPRLHSFKIQPLRYSFDTTFISGQGMCFSQGRIWCITGVPHSEREGSGSARIVVYNTKNMCTESMIFFEDIGLVPENTAEYEPESIFIWNNQLYAAFRGFIARIIKIDLV